MLYSEPFQINQRQPSTSTLISDSLSEKFPDSGTKATHKGLIVLYSCRGCSFDVPNRSVYVLDFIEEKILSLKQLSGALFLCDLSSLKDDPFIHVYRGETKIS